MNPMDHGESYDSIELAGRRSPGIVTLSGHDRNHKWDVKDADGAGGASTTYKGESVSQFTASFYLVKDPVAGADDFADWEPFARLIRSSIPNSGKPKALKIYHPDLAMPGIEISSVCAQSIGGLQHDGKGGATVDVKFLEFRPPKKKGGSPTTTKGSAAAKTGGDPAKPDPNADLKAQIVPLLAEAKKP
jgi:hypothetical protein